MEKLKETRRVNPKEENQRETNKEIAKKEKGEVSC